MLAICVLHSLEAGHYAEFYPINGTFQNYNPVRRLLDGQIAYKDFQDYLGMGHLFVGAAATGLFGGTYRASLMAFSFLSFVGLASIFMCMGMAIFRKKEISVTVTNLCLLMLLIQPLFFENVLCGIDEIYYALRTALETGNSARYVRGMILPLSIALLSVFRYKSERTIINSVYIGLVAGFSFVWSNDYGISCWVCLAIMTFWVLLSKSRNIKQAVLGTFIEILVSIIGICIFVEIFTLGHLTDWFKAIFGTGGYQSWYYNTSQKSYYLYDVDFSYFMLIPALLCLIYLYWIFKNRASKESIIRHGIPAFTNMVSFCAANEYKMLSGQYLRDIALAVLFVNILFESIFFLGYSLKNKKRVAVIASSVIGIAWCISTFKEEFVLETEKEGVYIEALGGNAVSHAGDLLAAQQFLNGKNFFSTYASAQEVVCDKYQPSGTDYIIHVLGDEARKDYLQAFREEDFEYTATIKDTTNVAFSEWECWVQRANWFFYRELYDGWHPVYANSYELYWERNKKPSENYNLSLGEISVVDVDDSTKKIIIQADHSVDGVADVYIDYHVNKGGGIRAKLLYQRNLKVQNTGVLYKDPYYESNYLPEESQEYIPIPIVNGYGEVTLSSCPKRDTALSLNEVFCDRIFPVNYHYVEALSVIDENGYAYITVPNYEKYMEALKSAIKITVNSVEYKIDGIKYDDTNIVVSIITEGALNPEGNLLDSANMLRVD